MRNTALVELKRKPLKMVETSDLSELKHGKFYFFLKNDKIMTDEPEANVEKFSRLT